MASTDCVSAPTDCVSAPTDCVLNDTTHEMKTRTREKLNADQPPTTKSVMTGPLVPVFSFAEISQLATAKEAELTKEQRLLAEMRDKATSHLKSFARWRLPYSKKALVLVNTIRDRPLNSLA